MIYLSKLLPLFVLPLGLAFLFWLVSLILVLFHHRKPAITLMLVGLCELYIASTPGFAHWMVLSLETQYPPVKISETSKADVAIILGGAVGASVSPRQSVELLESSDRVLHGKRLYQAGKVTTILVTGGNISFLPGDMAEAELIMNLLVEWGVDRNKVRISHKSRNTLENAEEIVAMREIDPFESALLVTSALHMPRALAIFEGAGLPVTPSTTDLLATNDVVKGPLRWLPDSLSLHHSSLALREWLGIIYLRLLGKI